MLLQVALVSKGDCKADSGGNDLIRRLQSASQ